MPSYEEARDSIERLLTQKKMKSEMAAYIEKLKGAAAIEKYDPPAN